MSLNCVVFLCILEGVSKFVYHVYITLLDQGVTACIYYVLCRINLTEVSTARELSTVQRDHPVVFLLVHDDQQDPDWHRAYSRVAQEKGVAAKFIYTTKIDLVQVHIHVHASFLCFHHIPLLT